MEEKDLKELCDYARYAFHYTGQKSEASAKKFLDRFPLPVIFNALQNMTDMEGLGNALVGCLAVVFKTEYGASFLPLHMPLMVVGLKSHFSEIQSLACKAVDCLLLMDYQGTKVSPVRLIVSHGIYPLLLDCIINSDDEVANVAILTIETLAHFPDAMSVIFPAETNDATHLGNISARSSTQARIRLMSLIVKLFWLLERCLWHYNTRDFLLLMEHGIEFVPQTSLIQLLCSVISGPSMGPNLMVSAFMLSGWLFKREDIYTTVEEACVEVLISAIDGSLESLEMTYIEYRTALAALGQIGTTKKGANLVLSTSSPAARHVVASACDCNAYIEQEAALHALADIAGDKWSYSGKILDGKAEESLRDLIYGNAAQSPKLTPSGLFLSILQSSKFCDGIYRALAALVARPWFLMEILSKEEIINIVTADTSRIVKHECCKAILEAFLSSTYVNDPRYAETVEKLKEAAQTSKCIDHTRSRWKQSQR